jgi:hypothetical protein
MEIDRMNKSRRLRQYQPDKFQGAGENELNQVLEDGVSEFLPVEGTHLSYKCVDTGLT